jgi:pimeloyl-ACP methyl ester carboxylesterase
VRNNFVKCLVTSTLVAASLLPWRGLAEVPPDRPTECVVVLHGMWRSGLAMMPLEWFLEEAGYGVVNVSYPSLSHSIEELAEIAVSEGVQQCRERGHDTINFVTHSLGGILVRQYLSRHELAGLGRVVMLGPPNQGSQMADYFLENPLTDFYQPEVLAQLGTGDASVPRRLGAVDFELGVIAGALNLRGVLPGSPDGISDGTVTVAETLVPGMTDFVLMQVTHTFMIWSRPVMEQALAFLRHGRFDRPPLDAEAG